MPLRARFDFVKATRETFFAPVSKTAYVALDPSLGRPMLPTLITYLAPGFIAHAVALTTLSPRMPSFASASSMDFIFLALSADIIIMRGTCVWPTKRTCSSRDQSEGHASEGLVIYPQPLGPENSPCVQAKPGPTQPYGLPRSHVICSLSSKFLVATAPGVRCVSSRPSAWKQSHEGRGESRGHLRTTLSDDQQRSIRGAETERLAVG